MIVGVVTFIFSPAITDKVRRSFDVSAMDFGGSSDLEIRNSGDGFASELLVQVQQVSGVEQAVPLLTQGGILQGQQELLSFFGIDPTLDRSIRSYNVSAGDFLSQSGEVMLTTTYAKEKNIHLGDRITLVGAGGKVELTVIGLLADHGPAHLNGGDILFINMEDAFRLHGSRTLNTISVVATADLKDLQVRLTNLLPADAVVDSPRSRLASVEDILIILELITDFCAIFVLVLGATLIYNTLAVSVVQRRQEIGVLRALGMTRDKVRVLFMAEAAVLGVIGSLLGIGAGYVLLLVVGDWVEVPALAYDNELYSYAAFRIPPQLPPLAFIAGILIALLAGYIPACIATNIDPIEALKHPHADTQFLPMNRVRLIGTPPVLILGVLLVATYDNSLERAPIVFVGIALVVLAATLIFPVMLVMLRNILPAQMQRIAGTPGLIAAENLTRRPGRMMAAGTILITGMWLLIQTGISSFGYGDYVKRWDRRENIWDLTLTGVDNSFSVSPKVIDEIEQRPDVVAVAYQRTISITWNQQTYDLRAEDITQFRAQGGRYLWQFGDEFTAYERLQTHDHPALLFLGVGALQDGLQVGQMITLETAQGPVEFELVGSPIVARSERGLVIDYSLFSELWGEPTVDTLQVKLKPGSDIQATRRDMVRAYANKGLMVYSAKDLMADLQAPLRSMAATALVITLLLGVTLVIGVANTLVIMVLDRRREVGILRAVGMRRREVNISVVIEVVLLVLLSGILAVPVGIFSLYASSLVIQHMLGWQIPANPMELTIVVSLMLLTSVIAASIPARHASQTDVLDVLRFE
jgi:putative ABC transport system permease protein